MRRDSPFPHAPLRREPSKITNGDAPDLTARRVGSRTPTVPHKGTTSLYHRCRGKPHMPVGQRNLALTGCSGSEITFSESTSPE
jgi:hypothetical protein